MIVVFIATANAVLPIVSSSDTVRPLAPSTTISCPPSATSSNIFLATLSFIGSISSTFIVTGTPLFSILLFTFLVHAGYLSLEA